MTTPLYNRSLTELHIRILQVIAFNPGIKIRQLEAAFYTRIWNRIQLLPGNQVRRALTELSQAGWIMSKRGFFLSETGQWGLNYCEPLELKWSADR